MSLHLKSTFAFALSLAVTLLLAWGAYRESRRIESTNDLMSLSIEQLQELDAVKQLVVDHQLGVSRFLLTGDESHLKAADAAAEAALQTLEALAGLKRREQAFTQDSAQPPDLEVGELQEIEQLRGLLEKTSQVVDPIIAIERRGEEEAAERLLAEDYERSYLDWVFASLDRLIELEIEHFEARRQRHDLAVKKLRSKAIHFGWIGGLVAVLAITFLKRSLDEIAEASRRESAANAAKSTFLANMSHEIRTPLNGILGFARLLAREPSVTASPAAVQHVSTILDSGRHLLGVINDVLDLSKVEAGQFKCTRTPCNAVALLEEVVSMARVRANAKSLPLSFAWEGPTPDAIHTDPVRFKQIVVNLVGNAIKFTEEGGVEVEARLDRSGDRAEMVVEVRDSGVGISPDDLDAIFQPFMQVDGSLTRQHEGTGLGLAISQRLAGLLGGEITVISRRGVGSTFTLRVDAGAADQVALLDSPQPTPRQTPKPDPAVAANLRGCRLLVVDDGDTNRALVRAVAEQAGAEVFEATNGLEGIEVAMAERVDAVLMDVQMPVMDGLTATATLRGRGFEEPIIALTAHAMPSDQQRCVEAGCSGYLSKPLEPDDLVREVAEQVRHAPRQHPAAAKPATHAAPGEVIRSTLPTDSPVFRRIARRFVEDLAERLERMREELEASDWDALADSAHWLKGAGGTAGFACFTEPAAHLYRVSKEHDPHRSEASLLEIASLLDRIAPEHRETEGTIAWHI